MLEKKGFLTFSRGNTGKEINLLCNLVSRTLKPEELIQ